MSEVVKHLVLVEVEAEMKMKMIAMLVLGLAMKPTTDHQTIQMNPNLEIPSRVKSIILPRVRPGSSQSY